MRRVLYLWLPQWPIDRRRKNGGAPADERPFATVAAAAGRRLLAAVNPAAAAAGLAPGMALADALAYRPGLATAPAEPEKDAAALRRLAEWCTRYSPWTAPDGADGVRIEITGAAHLWGGEAALAADLAARLARRGLAHRLAIAGTLGAAWAAARFARASPAILPPDDPRAALAPLPIEALRLDPATAAGLRRVGLDRVGALYPMPRDALARRFGAAVARRLDQTLGRMAEPLSPLGEAPARRARLSFAEPISDPADLARATERLAADLAGRLAREGRGARRLALAFHRVDGWVERLVVGTARPSRDPRHLAALFVARLEAIDPGPGIEDMILALFAAEPLAPEQLGLAGSPAAASPDASADGIAPLLDRLGNRLGLAALARLEPRESHIPERASVIRANSARAALPPLTQLRVRLAFGSPTLRNPLSPMGGEDRVRGAAPIRCNRVENRIGPEGSSRNDERISSQPVGSRADKPPRPVRLFDPPEPIEAFFLLPDEPPFRFLWRRRRHRVVRADGPERIAAEWWRPDAAAAADAIRDYYRVEDAEGRRFWLFRAGPAGHDPHRPRWFLHGLFA